MKTILGKTIIRKHIYQYESLATPGKRTIWINGMIWLEGDFNILIRKGKFFLQHKDGKAHGHILRGTKAHKVLKRIIGRWQQLYRKHGIFNHGVDDFRNSIRQSLYALNECRRAKLLRDLDSNKYYELNGF